MDWNLYWLGFILVVVMVCMIKYYIIKWRRESLMRKYGDSDIVAKIMKGRFWQGQTEEQLLDSLGKPLNVEQKVLKNKTKETWKYNKTGKNRYALKVILENDKVVGWDQK